jgi:hypothetical protein
MCSKSSALVVFALDLKSAYEGEHMIFGLLGLANLAQDDVMQFHPFTWWFPKQVRNWRLLVGALRVSPFHVAWGCYALAGGVEDSEFYLFLMVFPAPASLQEFTLGSTLSASSH